MRLRNRKSPLLLLLLPSLVVAAAVDHAFDPESNVGTNVAASGRRSGTKDAPVDGNEGKPHAGPFVQLRTDPDSSDDLPALKDRPEDPLVVNGQRIPERHDGINDQDRPEPNSGITGLEGGVSEKDKQRRLREVELGEKAENKPPTPKAARAADDAKQNDKSSTDASGLEKPADLPEKTHDKVPPVPESVAGIDHLDTSKGGRIRKPTSLDHGYDDDSDDEDEDEGEGLIRPFHSFMLSFTMIIFSEIGDKTFLVAALMAMKHDRMVVFSAAFGALIAMTVLSAVLGHAVPTLIPKRLTTFLAAALFLVFGARLLREGLAMSPDEGVSGEMQEVEAEIAEKESLAREKGRRGSDVSAYALESGLGPRKSRSKSRFPAPPRSPSSSPEGRSPSPQPGALVGFLSGLNNLLSLLLSPAWVQTFVMTFLGEWGDRSQIATIAMAAGQDYWWVTLGAIVGHACCTGMAVIGGRAIAGKVSLKVVTVGGAIAFLVFALIYLIEALYA
ncbi:hypothetical protein VTJ49DRAFT_2099 [Mycothermus thermophilus]|uniref:Uncharacterized protein n=1 Tax=Humicola insolens TaxID=85995 RepID=A0ABR3VAM3_HUMIN